MQKNTEVEKHAKKISGQILGIEKMITEGRECGDIVQQIIAVRSSLASLGTKLLISGNPNCKTKSIAQQDMKKYLENVIKLTK